jgi:hypothetical protein
MEFCRCCSPCIGLKAHFGRFSAFDHTTKKPNSRGEALTPDPSPRTGEGRSSHPRPLCQGGRGEKPSPPSPSAKAGEGRSPHPRPLCQGGRGEKALTPDPSAKAGEGRSPHPRPLCQGGRGEKALTPDPSAKAGSGADRSGDKGQFLLKN